MSYELAPATKLVATHCAACGRPLVDAASLAASMGPECRLKYGVPGLEEATRAAANEHIYRIALLQVGGEVAERLAALRALGFEDLATRITKRLAPLYLAVIEREGERLVVRARYAVSESAQLGAIAGARWDRTRKVRSFPLSARRALFEALRAAHPGARCLGPHGEFTL